MQLSMSVLQSATQHAAYHGSRAGGGAEQVVQCMPTAALNTCRGLLTSVWCRWWHACLPTYSMQAAAQHWQWLLHFDHLCGQPACSTKAGAAALPAQHVSLQQHCLGRLKAVEVAEVQHAPQPHHAD